MVATTVHRRESMRGDPVSGLWVESETLGQTGGSTTSTNFGGTMTCVAQFAMDCRVSAISYDFRVAGTYEFRIDGVLIDTVSPGASGVTNVIANVQPIRVTRGDHEFKVTKTAGANGWNYNNGDGSGYAPWLGIGYWQEAGGAEYPPIQVTVVATQRPMLYQWATVTGVGSGNPRKRVGQHVTWKRPVECVGLITGHGAVAKAAWQVSIDGVVVGTDTGGAYNASYPAGIITLNTPFLFLPGQMHYISVQAINDTDIQGIPYVNTAEWRTDEWLTQGAWLDPVAGDPTSTGPCLGWLINPIVPG